jgi:nitroreductase
VLDRDTVEAALDVAVRAPSIHNTQPWRWQLRPDGLVLRADRSRQLDIADPDGHSLMISCGAAGALTELALRAAGVAVEVRRFPDPSDPDALARYAPTGADEPDDDVQAQVDAALRRRSDRRPYRLHDVPAAEIERLRAAGGNDLAFVDFPMSEDQRINLAVAVTWADRIERHDEAYIAEMQKWLRDPEVHDDGVIWQNVPHVEEGHPRRSNVPQRDFELGMPGMQMIERDVDEKPLIAVILTAADTAEEQLAAGEAMMRLMLRAELDGLGTCPLSQAVDLVAFRTRLQGLMGWVGYPQMMMRLGYPNEGQIAETPRRPVSAVLDVVA